MNISKERITQIVEEKYNEQRENLVRDLDIANKCVCNKDNSIPHYDQMKTIIVTENHIKNILIDVLSELLIEEWC